MTFEFNPDDPPPVDAGLFGMSLAPEDAGVWLIPVPVEATTSYGAGTSFGPEAMRRASHQMDFFDLEFGRPWQAGFATLNDERLTRIEALDQQARGLARAARGQSGASQARTIAEVNRLTEELHGLVRAVAGEGHSAGKLVALVGGDHSTAFGGVAAAVAAEGELGVLQLDAHADLRVAYEGYRWSHASVMHNVLAELPEVTRLVQVGIRDFSEAEHSAIHDSGGRIVTVFDQELVPTRTGTRSFDDVIKPALEQLPEKIYLSFDIDGLDPALCPATGTPVPGGLSWAEIQRLLTLVAESGHRIVGLDLCEVAPSGGKVVADNDGAVNDGQPSAPEDLYADEWDANVGARLLYRMIGLALKTRG